MAPFLLVARDNGVPWRPEWDRLGLHPDTDLRDVWLASRDAYLLMHNLAYREGISSLGFQVEMAGYGQLAITDEFRLALDASPSLLDALVTARTRSHLQNSSLRIGFRLTPDELWVCHRGLAERGMPGQEHVEIHRTLRVIHEVRRYAGSEWRPSHLGLMQSEPVDEMFLSWLRPDRVDTDLPVGFVPVPRSLFESSFAAEGLVESGPSSPVPWLVLLEAALPSMLGNGCSATVDQVAEVQGLSTRTLQRRLREEGTTYREVLTRARLTEARRLLVVTDDPVHEVARRVGYSDPSNFGRAFRRFFGLGPDELRSLMRGRTETG